MIRVLLLLLCATAAAADPAFVSRTAGVPDPQVYAGGWEHFVGGGVAILDCDGDGFADLFTAGGSNPAKLYVNATGTPGASIRFQAGALPTLTDVTGAWPLDIDGDGNLDLAVLRVGADVLLRGDGRCGFTDATRAWGLATRDAWSTAFSATWEAGESWPTLAIGAYVDRADPNGPFGACDTNLLVRPDGRRFAAPVALAPGYCALSMLISDWTRTGRRDLRISNDRHYYVKGGYEEMWTLRPLRPLGPEDGWQRVSLWGMGIASRDLDGDGRPEVMLTSMGDQLLQLNRPSGLVAAPFATGTYAQRPFRGDDGRPSTGWHAEFADVDNDGRDDLFIAKGNVDQMPSNAMRDPNDLLMQRADATFVEKAHEAGVDTDARSRGAGLADLNRDGRLDLVVMNRRAPMEVWENATAGTGHWLEIEPRLTGPNTRAVGAWIEVDADGRVQSREITVGGGHGSGQAGPQHFGLGAAETARVRVTWPDGTASPWADIAADARITVRLGAAGLVIERLN